MLKRGNPKSSEVEDKIRRYAADDLINFWTNKKGGNNNPGFVRVYDDAKAEYNPDDQRIGFKLKAEETITFETFLHEVKHAARDMDKISKSHTISEQEKRAMTPEEYSNNTTVYEIYDFGACSTVSQNTNNRNKWLEEYGAYS